MNNVIRLQLIDGNFYPTDKDSRSVLEDLFHISRFPDIRFDTLSPVLIRKGYKLAVTGYVPEVYQRSESYRMTGREIEPVKNPCLKCYLKGLCDSDECGRKNYKLFT